MTCNAKESAVYFQYKKTEDRWSYAKRSLERRQLCKEWTKRPSPPSSPCKSDDEDDEDQANGSGENVAVEALLGTTGFHKNEDDDEYGWGWDAA